LGCDRDRVSGGTAMTEVALIVDTASIEVRTSGPTTGTIVVRVGDVLFPTADWNDFVVVIVEAWVSALRRLAAGETSNARVQLMEGPYAVDIARLSTGHYRLRALKRPDRERARSDVLPGLLVEDALRAGACVLQHCRNAGDQSADLRRLESSLQALRTGAAELTN
jgi:hypothetical protein